MLDLLVLAAKHADALDAALGPLLADGRVTKLGLELAGDLSRLAGSWPRVRCFRAVARALDVRSLWVVHAQAAQPGGASVRQLASYGLSRLCAELLGKPLGAARMQRCWDDPD